MNTEEVFSLEVWNAFVAENSMTSIDVPYGMLLGAVNIAGIFHLRDPFAESSTEGVLIGAVNGTYTLSKDNLEAPLYDPTGQFFRLVVGLNIPGRELWARIDNRNWNGTWNEGDRAILWRG
ncbi:hypothetical protein EI533_26090 [Pseudomonas donghuensis]|nr:hypothetical protein [Pseudomonas donghuensis]